MALITHFKRPLVEPSNAPAAITPGYLKIGSIADSAEAEKQGIGRGYSADALCRQMETEASTHQE